MAGTFGKGAAKWRAKRGNMYKPASPAKPDHGPERKTEPEAPATPARHQSRVATAADPAPSAEPMAHRWLKANECVRVHGRTIQGPCYVGTGSAEGDPRTAAASIDPKLGIAERSEPEPYPLATTFQALNAGDRGRHLDWITAGRPPGEEVHERPAPVRYRVPGTACGDAGTSHRPGRRRVAD